MDAEGIEASFDNGVLEVRVPKPQARRPQRVTIGLSRQEGETIEAGEPAGDPANGGRIAG